MEWKNILKVELPEKPEAGTPVTNEHRMAMDNWAREFENRMVYQLNDVTDSPFFKLMPNGNILVESLGEKSKADLANLLKGFVRDVDRNQNSNKYNYVSNILTASKKDNFVNIMATNSSYIDEFIRYVKG